eukprot:m.184354 g.184354  ORF g.184354 m.184354 type:complete len:161 (-) comp15011_c0_seq3:1565-2047(-)
MATIPRARPPKSSARGSAVSALCHELATAATGACPRGRATPSPTAVDANCEVPRADFPPLSVMMPPTLVRHCDLRTVQTELQIQPRLSWVVTRQPAHVPCTTEAVGRCDRRSGLFVESKTRYARKCEWCDNVKLKLKDFVTPTHDLSGNLNSSTGVCGCK